MLLEIIRRRGQVSSRLGPGALRPRWDKRGTPRLERCSYLRFFLPPGLALPRAGRLPAFLGLDSDFRLPKIASYPSENFFVSANPTRTILTAPTSVALIGERSRTPIRQPLLPAHRCRS